MASDEALAEAVHCAPFGEHLQTAAQQGCAARRIAAVGAARRRRGRGRRWRGRGRRRRGSRRRRLWRLRRRRWVGVVAEHFDLAQRHPNEALEPDVAPRQRRHALQRDGRRLLRREHDAARAQPRRTAWPLVGERVQARVVAATRGRSTDEHGDVAAHVGVGRDGVRRTGHEDACDGRRGAQVDLHPLPVAPKRRGVAVGKAMVEALCAVEAGGWHLAVGGASDAGAREALRRLDGLALRQVGVGRRRKW